MFKITKIFTNNTGKTVGYDEFDFQTNIFDENNKMYQNIILNYKTGSGKGTFVRNLAVATSPMLDYTIKSSSKYTFYNRLIETDLAGDNIKLEDGTHIIREAFNSESPKAYKSSFIAILYTAEDTSSLINTEIAMIVYTYPDIESGKVGKLKRVIVHGRMEEVESFHSSLIEKMKINIEFENNIEEVINDIKDSSLRIEQESSHTRNSVLIKKGSPFFLGTDTKMDNLIILNYQFGSAEESIKTISIKQLHSALVKKIIKSNYFQTVHTGLSNILEELDNVFEIRNSDIRIYKKILSYQEDFKLIPKIDEEFLLLKEAISKYNNILNRELFLAKGNIEECSVIDLELNDKLKKLNVEIEKSQTNLLLMKKQIKNFFKFSFTDNELLYTRLDFTEEFSKITAEKIKIEEEIKELKKNLSNIEEFKKDKLNQIYLKNKNIEELQKNISYQQMEKEKLIYSLDNFEDKKELYSNTQDEENKFAFFVLSAFNKDSLEVKKEITNTINSIYNIFNMIFNNNLSVQVDALWNKRKLNQTKESLLKDIKYCNDKISIDLNAIEVLKKEVEEIQRNLEKYKDTENIVRDISYNEDLSRKISDKLKTVEGKRQLFFQEYIDLDLPFIEERKKVFKDYKLKKKAIRKLLQDKKNLKKEIFNNNKLIEDYKKVLSFSPIEEEKYLFDVVIETHKYELCTIKDLTSIKQDIEEYKQNIDNFHTKLSFLLRSVEGEIWSNDKFKDDYMEIHQYVEDIGTKSITGIEAYQYLEKFFFKINAFQSSSTDKQLTVASNLLDTNRLSVLWELKDRINNPVLTEIKKINKQLSKDKTSMKFYYKMNEIEELNISIFDHLEVVFNEMVDSFSLFNSSNRVVHNNEIKEFINNLFDKEIIDQSVLKRFKLAIEDIFNVLFLSEEKFSKEIDKILKKDLSINLLDLNNSFKTQASSGNKLIAGWIAQKKFIEREMESEDCNVFLPFVLDEASKSEYAYTIIEDGINIVTQQDHVSVHIRKRGILYRNHQSFKREELSLFNEEMVNETLKEGKDDDTGLWKTYREKDFVFDGREDK